MKSVRIIPCLDVSNGRTVKGVNFVDLRDAGDPVELAQRYDAQGADELVFLDITATSDNRQTAFEMAQKVAATVFIPFTIGGGVRTVEDARALLLAGADKVAVNSAAVARPELIADIAQEFGSQCCVVAVDARFDEATGDYIVHTHGGRTSTQRTVVDWVTQCESLGAGELLLTSMDRDGTKSGFDIALTTLVSGQVSIPVIASGGVGDVSHFAPAAIEANADGLLAASIFHFGEVTVAEVKEALLASNVNVRPAYT